MKMASCKSEHFINILPDEVLCIIFDHLDIESVKSVSRSCKRWNNIVFHSSYVGRFMFNIDIPSPKMVFKNSKQRKKTVKGLVEKLVAITKFTERKYRHLRIVLNIHVIDSFQSMWEIIHPKVTATIKSLQLTFKLFTDDRIIRPMMEAIVEMPKLQSVWLKSHGFVSLRQDVTPTMRSTTVEHLQLEAAGFVVDMPQLRSFKGPLLSLVRPIDSPHPLVLANLRQVKLSGNGSKLTASSVIHRIQLVDSMEFSSELSDGLFIAICDTCASLKELNLQEELLLFDPRSLDHLSRLSNLRRLTFKSIRSMKDCALKIDLQKLTQLEQVDLGSTVVDATSLLTLPNSIRTLAVRIDYENERNIMHTISSLDHLTDLFLCSGVKDWRPSIETFQVLSLLKHLRVLQLCSRLITVDYFHGMQAPMYQVRSLVLLHLLHLERNTLRMARIKFPNAKLVKIINKRDVVPQY